MFLLPFPPQQPSVSHRLGSIQQEPTIAPHSSPMSCRLSEILRQQALNKPELLIASDTKLKSIVSEHSFKEVCERAMNQRWQGMECLSATMPRLGIALPLAS